MTVIPILVMGFTLNKREFKDGLKLRYDWPFKLIIISLTLDFVRMFWVILNESSS